MNLQFGTGKTGMVDSNSDVSIEEQIQGWEMCVAAQREIVESFIMKRYFEQARERLIVLKEWEQKLSFLRGQRAPNTSTKTSTTKIKRTEK